MVDTLAPAPATIQLLVPGPLPLSRLLWQAADGTTLNLDDGSYLLLAGFDGAGVPMVRRDAVQTPRRRGTSLVSTTMEARYLRVRLGLFAASFEAIQAQRRAVISTIKQEVGSDLGTLLWTPRLGIDAAPTTYAIDCSLEDGAGFDASLGPAAEELALSFFCPDPTWRVMPEREDEIAVDNAGMEVPTDIPMDIGARTGVAAIANAGDIAAAPVLECAGPFTNPRFTNQTTGQELRLILTVAAGETLALDMDERTAEVDGVNVLSKVTLDSEFWELAVGSNTIEVYLMTGVTTLTVRRYDRLVGV